MANILLAVKDALGDKAFRAMCNQICGEQDEDAPEAEDDETFESPEAREQEQLDAKDRKRAKDKKMGKDTPPDFEGKPSTNTAMDAAADPRFDYLRDMQRVKPDNGSAFTDRTSQARRAPSTASAERSFEAMYGQQAVNIKAR